MIWRKERLVLAAMLIAAFLPGRAAGRDLDGYLRVQPPRPLDTTAFVANTYSRSMNTLDVGSRQVPGTRHFPAEFPLCPVKKQKMVWLSTGEYCIIETTYNEVIGLGLGLSSGRACSCTTSS